MRIISRVHSLKRINTLSEAEENDDVCGSHLASSQDVIPD